MDTQTSKDRTDDRTPGPDSSKAGFLRSHRRLITRIAIGAAIAVGVVLLVVVASVLWMGAQIRLEDDKLAEVDQALTPRGFFEPIDVLLVGVDRTQRGTRRADTMILARIDVPKRRIWMLSIPRDTNIGLAARDKDAAPTCTAALKQATLKHPDRNKASDGIVARSEHNEENPLSDHRWGYAFDLTHDPQNGVDCGSIAESIRRSRDTRVKYVIFNGRYFSASEGWRWRPYTGSSPHTKHMHVSVTSSGFDDTRPWPGIMYEVEPKPLRDVASWLGARPADPDEEHAGMKEFAEEKYVKANKAYTVGGPALTIDAVERLLDLPVHHYVEVDFRALTEIVDAVGGVKIDVPEAIDDEEAANASPGSRARRIPAGLQTLDGEHALTFVRSRAYWDADFTRMRNQQAFMRALLRRLVSPRGLVGLPGVAAAVGKDASTDLSGPELLWLAGAMASTGGRNLSTATLNGAWRSPVVIPDENRKLALIESMIGGADFVPATAEVSVTVLNGSGRAGLARFVAAELVRLGFRVERIDNAQSDDYTQTTVYARDQDQAAAKLVARSLSPSTLGSDPTDGYTTRVLVVVGGSR